MEYLVEIDIRLPYEFGAEERDELANKESARGAALAESGTIRAIWRVPGRLANRGIWSAPNATALHEAIVSLPMWPFMNVVVTPLAGHGLAAHCQGIPPGLTTGG